MQDLEKIIKWFEYDYLPRVGAYRKDCKQGCDACMPMHEGDDYCDIDMLSKVLSLLKEQEPRVLQIKEMAFPEIAVFVETNGDLEGKGTDLFLAIPYIYAVSQNMLYGYIAFVDGNTDVYDLQAIYYGKRWRCWTSRPTDEQRRAMKWE